MHQIKRASITSVVVPLASVILWAKFENGLPLLIALPALIIVATLFWAKQEYARSKRRIEFAKNLIHPPHSGPA